MINDSRTLILFACGDSPEMAVLADALVNEGYRIEQCADAHHLLNDYARLSPQLVVLDSALTGGDAFACCGRLREGESVPILMLVANEASDVERAFRAGASDVLVKPIQPILLSRRVRALHDGERVTRQVGEQERRWHQAFERNRSIQLIVNPQTGQIVDANPAACAFYGYTREDFRRKYVTDLDAPDDWQDDQPSMFNFRHRAANGELRDVKIFSSPLEYNGQTMLYLIVNDLSKRRRTDPVNPDQRMLAEALRNTVAVLSSTLDQNEVLDRILEQVNLVVPNDSANIMLIEAGVARVVRLQGYDVALIPVMEAVRRKVRETPTLNHMLENNRALVISNVDDFPDWVDEDGSYDWIKSYVAAPIRIGNHVIGFLNLDSGTPNRFSSTDADHLQAFADQAAIAIRNARLYDRVRHQASEMERRVLQRTAELEYERSQLRAIMDAMTEGVAYTEAVNGEFHTRYVNRALAEMTGYSLDEWNKYSLNLFRTKGMNDDQFEVELHTAVDELRATGYWRSDARLVRKDGTEFDAVMITTRVNGLSGDVTGAVSVIRDISREKALQQQKERFVAHASHELRTPITNLKTRLYLMRRQPERLDEHMRVLEQVTDRMKRLVEDLLDISRFERGVIKLELQHVILQDVIHNLVLVQKAEAERKFLQVDCNLPEEPIVVFADAERLAQVITNLITNAINYTPDGGKIDVRLLHLRDDDDNRALVEVEDTGIGIAEEHLPHIFQPFYRVVSQVEGTGLGLSITKEIVELHGGELTVDSRVGKGSTFRFWLPLVGALELTESEGA